MGPAGCGQGGVVGGLREWGCGRNPGPAGLPYIGREPPTLCGGLHHVILFIIITQLAGSTHIYVGGT